MLINWFIEKFHNYCSLNDKVYINSDDFALIVADLEVRIWIFDRQIKFSFFLALVWLQVFCTHRTKVAQTKHSSTCNLTRSYC